MPRQSQKKVKIIGHEYPPSEEAGIVEQMITEMKSQLLKLYPPGGTLRQAHPKMHGNVEAEFIVEANLPVELKIGVFKTSNTYPCRIRFSNAHSTVQADTKKDVRGMAIKLLNVHGEKLLINEIDNLQQDFLLISSNTFIARNLAQFHKTIKALTSGKLFTYFINPLHWGVLKRTLNSFIACKHVLTIPYWSTTPYQFGDMTRAVKYHVSPSGNELITAGDTISPDYLRINLASTLAKHDAYFDFFVQFQTDAARMPVEDPTIEWKSQFIKLATIKIPKQVFDTPLLNKQGEDMCFSPWHGLTEHRPLGGINRGRKHAYETIQSFRLAHNQVPRDKMVSSSGSKSKNPNMSNPANEKIVEQLFTCYGKHDLGGVFKLLDPGVVWLEPGFPDIPFAGTFNGLAAVQGMMASENKLLEVLDFKTKAYFSNKDMVLVTGNDKTMVKTTKNVYSTDWVMEFTVDNGKIIRVQTFMDTNAIVKAFNKAPDPQRSDSSQVSDSRN